MFLFIALTCLSKETTTFCITYFSIDLRKQMVFSTNSFLEENKDSNLEGSLLYAPRLS